MTFDKAADLIADLRKSNAPKGFLEWIDKRSDITTILTTCPITYRIWAIKAGYRQFENDIDWGQVSAFNMKRLIKLDVDPPLSMLNGASLAAVVVHNPKTFNKKVREAHADKLTGQDWLTIIMSEPELAKYCNWCSMTDFQKHKLVGELPEMLAYLPELRNKEKDNDKN